MADDRLGAHVFVSYASVDTSRIAPVVAALERSGVPVWQDRSGIPGGAIYAPEIAAAIRNCAVFLLCCTASAFASRNVRQEIALAWKHARPILPVLLEPVTIPEDLEYWLEATQWIEVLDGPGSEWQFDLLRAITRLVGETAQSKQGLPSSAAVATARLPTPATRLVGREMVVANVAELLNTHRLVTLLGPGGVGKTRLAIDVARSVSVRFPDGVAFVDLSAIRDPDLVVPTVAATVGVREQEQQTALHALANALADQQRLFVLDNFEQVLDAAPDVAGLLVACPNLTLLATSRAPLMLRGEQRFLVEPLPTPPSTHHHEDVLANPAVALFAERAAEVRPDFTVTGENLPAIAEICTRLEGLPLAIELAAARIRLWPPEVLLERLDHRLPVLTGGARDLPDRQRTLRDTVAWSYELLADRDRTLFRRLAVFRGGFTPDAVQIVCGIDDDLEIMEALTVLVDTSLITGRSTPSSTNADRRFGMLEVIREFALEQLVASGDDESTRRRHAEWCLDLAERAYAVCVHGAIQPEWISRISSEQGNMRAALAWLEQSGDVDAWLRLAATLQPFWYLAGLGREVEEWLERGLTQPQATSAETRARALHWASSRANVRGNYAEALALAEECGRLYTSLGDTWGKAVADHLTGNARVGSGDPERAQQLYDRALAGFRQTSSTDWEALVQVELGTMALDLGDFDGAETYLSEALALSEALNDPWGQATALNGLSVAALERADHTAAASRLARALQAWQELGTESADFAHWLEAMALLAALGATAETAARFLGAAAVHRERTGEEPRPAERLRVARMTEHFIEELGPDGFAEAHAEGRDASLRQIETAADSILARLTEQSR